MNRQVLGGLLGAAVIVVSGVALGLPSAPLKCDYDQHTEGFQAFGGGAPVMNGQLPVSNSPTSCKAPGTPYNAVDNATTQFRYDKFSFENRTGQPTTCVTISLQEEPNFAQGETVTGLQVAAYDSSNGKTGFVPSNPLTNWIGDSGVPTANGGTVLGHVVSTVTQFSVNVSSTFDVVVNEFTSNHGNPYHLTVSGCGNTFVSAISKNWDTVDGGGSYTITGSGFVTNSDAGVGVTLQGVAPSTVTVVGDNSLAVTPAPWPNDPANLMAGTPGDVVVTVGEPTIPGGTISQTPADSGAPSTAPVTSTLPGQFTYYNWIPSVISYPETPDTHGGGYDVYATTYGTNVPLAAVVTPDPSFPVPPQNPFPSGNVQFDLMSDDPGPLGGCGCGINPVSTNGGVFNTGGGCTCGGNSISAYALDNPVPVTATGKASLATSAWTFGSVVPGGPFPPLVQRGSGPTVLYVDNPNSYAVFAQYLGDGQLFLPTALPTAATRTVSPVVGVSIAQDGTNLSVVSQPNAANINTQIVLTASVTPATPVVANAVALSGTFDFTVDGATPPGGSGVPGHVDPTTGDLVATLTIPGFDNAHTGAHAVVATYSGDRNYAGSTNTTTEIVQLDPTSVSTTADPVGPITFGTPFSFGVVVSDLSGPAPTGPIQVQDQLGNRLTCSGPTPDTQSESYTCTEPAGAFASLVGNVTATATYEGDSNTQPGETGQGSIIINPAVTTTTSGTTGTIAFGDPLTLAATVTGNDPQATALQPVVGALSFTAKAPDGGVSTLCSTVTIDDAGAANCGTGNGLGPAIAPGSTLSTAFGGGQFYAPSNTAIAVTINQADSGTSVSDNSDGGAVILGDTVTLTANVATTDKNAAHFASPTGAVKFALSDGGVLCGASALSGSIATCTTPSLGTGSISVTATYLGDPNYSGSQSTVDTVVVGKAASKVTISSPANNAPFTTGANVSVTATVSSNDTSALGLATPSGTVTVTLGSGTCTVTLSGGTGGCSVAAPSSAGTATVTAAYGGDSNYSASASSPVNLTISAPPPPDAGVDASADAGDGGHVVFGDSGSDAEVDSSVDSGPDSSTDGAVDASRDGETDGAVDSGGDSGPTADSGVLDAAPSADAATMADAQAKDAAADAQALADAGGAGDGGDGGAYTPGGGGGGCSCHTTGGSTSTGDGAMFLVGAVVVLARRRRSSKRAA